MRPDAAVDPRFREWRLRASRRKRRDVLGLSVPIVAVIAAGYLLVLHAWSWWLFPAASLCASVLFFGLSCWSRGYIAALAETRSLIEDVVAQGHGDAADPYEVSYERLVEIRGLFRQGPTGLDPRDGVTSGDLAAAVEDLLAERDQPNGDSA